MTRKPPQFTPIEQTVAGRWFYLVFGVLVIAGSVITLSVGKLHYQNYRRDNVFAPFGIVIGILAIIIYIRNRKPRSPRKSN